MSRRYKEKEPRQGGAKIDLRPETRNGILIVVFLTLAVLSLLSFWVKAGIFGVYFYKIFSLLFGKWGYFLIPIGLILTVIALFKSFYKNICFTILFGIGLFGLSVLGILHLAVKNNGGGLIGYFIVLPFLKFLGIYAAYVVLIAFVLISIIIVFNLSLAKVWESLVGKAKKEEEVERLKITQNQMAVIPEKERLLGKIFSGLNGRGQDQSKPKFKINTIDSQKEEAKGKEKKTEEKRLEVELLPSAKLANYKLPSLDLLEADTGTPLSGDIRANANIIKRTLQNFAIEVEMAEVNVGPTVTQYTFRPAQGVKLSKISALQNDLALALAVHPIRMETPIPGRSLVGIEIPNKVITKVRLKNLLEQPEFAHDHMALTLALGRDVAGNAVFANLERMPHLLIAGATGTGKTICLNTVIMSLLCCHSPELLKFILIDPKRVEFPVYNGLPHLLSPVVMDAEKTVNVLRWAVSEMERRFEILSEANTRDIGVYNKKYSNEPLPFIIIIIDELADLMASHGREVEAAIVRLAQMARAVGIHLVVATQRPSVEVITGLIKANITSRIAFQVASQVDSRTILDGAGAEKLLGNGDLLFLSGDASKPRRIQGTYVSDKELKRVADFIKNQKEPEYDQQMLKNIDKQAMTWNDGNSMDDELYEEAKKVVMQAGKASASLLQRRLRIGYARAARLLDILEAKGVVGPGDGAKPREVYGLGDSDEGGYDEWGNKID